MIFATVGTQLPFDRLLGALDAWAALHPKEEVMAQTGQTSGRFENLLCKESLSQSEFQQAFANAQVIVAHAGMGTILSAAEMGKPIILMPREAALGEHRNDHQADTAAEMAVLPNVTVVRDAAGLAEALDRILENPHDLTAGSSEATPALIAALHNFIFPEKAKESRK